MRLWVYVALAGEWNVVALIGGFRRCVVWPVDIGVPATPSDHGGSLFE